MRSELIQATKYSNRNYLLYLKKKCKGSLYEGEKFFLEKIGQNMAYTCRLEQLQKSLFRRRRRPNKIYIQAKIKKLISSLAIRNTRSHDASWFDEKRHLMT